MKHEWRKKEKDIYMPKSKPEEVLLPDFKYFTIEGQGNPNDPSFSSYIEVLYALSYAVKMSVKSGKEPEGFYDYVVYPLEGLWDLKEETKPVEGQFNKEDLIFKLMIRQPDFVTSAYATEIIEQVKIKKKLPLLDQIKFEIIEEGSCVQVLHVGSYDSEALSFDKINAYCKEHQLKRKYHSHREIYLSDFRRVAKDKLKTVLRVEVLPLK